MKKKNTSKRLLSTVLAVPAVSLFPLSMTSCGLNQPWDWKTATKDNTQINYCLLIGQNDHTDSQMRTKGCREALKTFDEASYIKANRNANIAKPKQGKITLLEDGTPGGKSQDFVVNEIEHMEQKSMSGASWDPITANATASTWIAKHGNNISFFVSNNDSMAEGAYWASNWIKGMPIFGYDANSSTLQWINNGGITGTVDQSPSNQAAAAMMILRKMYDEKKQLWGADEYKPTEGGFGSKTYDPTADTGVQGAKGNGFSSHYVDANNNDFGQVNKPDEKGPTQYFTLRKDRKHDQSGSIFDSHEILAKSTAITNLDKNTVEALRTDIVDISKFMMDDHKTAKQPKDMFDSFTDIKKPDGNVETFDICHTYSNRSEAFLIATMKPYYDEYASRMGINPDVIQGDGTDETIVLNEIKARQRAYPGGYLICLAKTTSGYQYVLDLAQTTFEYEKRTLGNKKDTYLKETWTWNKDGWDDNHFDWRLDTPLIFWIREPYTPGGTIDSSILEANKYFKYCYYIGSDSANAGEVQGKMITSAITKWYTESIKE